MDELWQRSLNAVGIKVDFQVKMFSEKNKAVQAGQLHMATFNWTDDTANDFMRLFYGAQRGCGQPCPIPERPVRRDPNRYRLHFS